MLKLKLIKLIVNCALSHAIHVHVYSTHTRVHTQTIKIIANLAAKTHQQFDTSSQHQGPNEQILRGHNCATQTSYAVTCRVAR